MSNSGTPSGGRAARSPVGSGGIAMSFAGNGGSGGVGGSGGGFARGGTAGVNGSGGSGFMDGGFTDAGSAGAGGSTGNADACGTDGNGACVTRCNPKSNRVECPPGEQCVE